MESTQKKDQIKSTPIFCCNTKKETLFANIEKDLMISHIENNGLYTFVHKRLEGHWAVCTKPLLMICLWFLLINLQGSGHVQSGDGMTYRHIQIISDTLWWTCILDLQHGFHQLLFVLAVFYNQTGTEDGVFKLDGCVQCSLDVLQNNILWCDQAKWVVCGVT